MQQFNGQQYINLETFRKSGIGVRTPVWFVQEGEALLVRTLGNSGKIKRLRNNAHLRVAPCDARGGLLGEWQEAEGKVITDPEENKRIDKLLSKKYGMAKTMFDMMGKLQKREYAGIVIHLEDGH